ncbi:SagB family peptide dehydrogenase, partial [Streptomonospora algeriensis]
PVAYTRLAEELPADERTQLARILGRVRRLLAFSVQAGGVELVRLEHTAADSGHAPEPVAPDARVRLSKFAACRSVGDRLVLESPLSKVRVVLVHPHARRLTAELGAAQRVRDRYDDGMPAAAVDTLLAHLKGAGLIEEADASGGLPSEREPVLRQWDFHDLLFHSRIRSGRYDGPHGALYSYRGEIDPAPAVKPVPEGAAVELYRPTWEETTKDDPALTEALEARRSIRTYADEPLTARQLGEFLYRTARVRAHFVPGADGEDEAVSRPYPSGGRAYELELYLTVRRCDGVPAGVYYYDPVAHRLVLVNRGEQDREAMLRVASMATGLEAHPDVLITVTSRFPRLSWKYRAIAYATTLRHTGVLYQTMYLVATAMGLAPCGLGNGDADLAARVLGLEYLEEASVGDFLLGSRDPGDALPSPGEGRAAPEDDGWRMANSPDWVLRAAQAVE